MPRLTITSCIAKTQSKLTSRQQEFDYMRNFLKLALMSIVLAVICIKTKTCNVVQKLKNTRFA